MIESILANRAVIWRYCWNTTKLNICYLMVRSTFWSAFWNV
jgi:hypothetical protein